MTKALGFQSNLELDPRSNRTKVGPKISTVTVAKGGTKVEKWYVNYFTQFDSILFVSSWDGGWNIFPLWLYNLLYLKPLVTQFEAFLDSQQALYDNYVHLQSGSFKRGIYKWDKLFETYHGFTVRFNDTDIFMMDETRPGYLNYQLNLIDKPSNFLMKVLRVKGYALQHHINSYRHEMNNNSIYTDDYLHALKMIGWGTAKADNELVLKPHGKAFKLAKQWGLQ